MTDPIEQRQWWKLWWYLPHWGCYGFRFKWMRNVYSRIKAIGIDNE